ncbi:MAG: F0F1 ATP synthase subunit epsilon [Planctomycetota bacterium]
MRFRLTEPTTLVEDREITVLQAEDATGRFGIRAGHEHFVTALEPSILVWRFPGEDGTGERERFAAVRGGVLHATGDRVVAAVRSAHVSEALDELEAIVRRARETRTERKRQSARSFYQMQIAAWRRIMEYEDDA